MFHSPVLRPRGPTRKCSCVHFCKVPSLSFSGSSFLRPCWNRVDGNKRESSDITDLHAAVVTLSWPRWTNLKFPLTDKYFPWGVLCDFPWHSQVGDSQHHGFLFNQGKCSGTHSLPPAVVTTASLFSSTCKHHLEKIKQPTGPPCIIDTLNNWMTEYWCASVHHCGFWTIDKLVT